MKPTEMKERGWKATWIDNGEALLWWHPRDPGANTIDFRHAVEIEKRYEKFTERRLGGKREN